MFLRNKRLPCIPSLFHENKFVTDFREKVEIFNYFFAKKCSVINTDSFLSSELLIKTDNSLYSVSFYTENLLKMVNNLHSNKARSHDEISIRMLKLCGPFVCRPFKTI